MEITYSCQGRNVTCSASDENLQLTEDRRDGRHTVTVTAAKPVCLQKAFLDTDLTYTAGDLVMANGYQSWTETKEFARGEYLNDLSRVPRPIQNRFHFKEYGSQAFRPMPKGERTGFDYAYVKGAKPFFIGSFNYRNAYLFIRFTDNTGRVRLESDVEGRMLEAGESFTVFDYVTEEDGSRYFDSFTPVTNRKLFGYTSWYNHYQDINAKLIDSTLEGTDERFDLFQIDDGFETKVGDWLSVDPVKFPEGLSGIVEKIHGRKLLAGIWLAPFVAETESALMKEHPDWIAKDEEGKFIYAGGNWSGDYPLDLNNPEAVDYIRSVLRHYVNMGFDFFKLDFLYAVNLKPLAGKTRAETSEYAYALLRGELEGKYILGCGATLFNAAEKFDFCRIGPDVSLKFDDVAYMRLFHPERISTKVTLLNTIFRSPMNGRLFMNDPDVFLLRDDNISMDADQRRSLATINALFGSLLMTSDNIAEYTGEKKKLLEDTLDLFHKAEVLHYRRSGSEVVIVYRLEDRIHSLIYDMSSGKMR